MVGSSLAKGFVDLTLNTKGLSQGMGSVTRALQPLGSAIKAGMVAGAAGFGLLAAGITKSIFAASELEETLSKFRTVFGPLSGEAEAWVDTTSKAVNRSRVDILRYMGTLQDTFVPFGFARDKASDLAKAVTTLGIDLASFNNISDDEAVQALTSALIGNGEAVRRFGIVLSEATLSAELLRMGVEGGTRAATEQEKVMARLAIIMRMTKDAQGDAVRTAGSFANQWKGLQAALTQAAADIGNEFLPMATSLVTWAREAAATMANWAVEIIRVGKTFLDIAEPIGRVLWEILAGGLEEVSSWFDSGSESVFTWGESLAITVASAAVAMSEFVDGVVFWFKDKIPATLARWVTGLGVHIGIAVDLWTAYMKDVGGMFVNLGDNIWEFLKAVGEWITGGEFNFDWKPLIDGNMQQAIADAENKLAAWDAVKSSMDPERTDSERTRKLRDAMAEVEKAAQKAAADRAAKANAKEKKDTPPWMRALLGLDSTTIGDTITAGGEAATGAAGAAAAAGVGTGGGLGTAALGDALKAFQAAQFDADNAAPKRTAEATEELVTVAERQVTLLEKLAGRGNGELTTTYVLGRS